MYLYYRFLTQKTFRRVCLDKLEKCSLYPAMTNICFFLLHLFFLLFSSAIALWCSDFLVSDKKCFYFFNYNFLHVHFTDLNSFIWSKLVLNPADAAFHRTISLLTEVAYVCQMGVRQSKWVLWNQSYHLCVSCMC